MEAIVRWALAAGVAMPLVYYGAQAIAAPFFPGFSVLRHTASELGSALSTRPELLNGGALLTGGAALLGAWGLGAALWGRRQRALALAAAGCLVSFGLASLWAGAHPLPDPRHDPGALGLGMFALPFVALAAAFALPMGRALRVYLALNVAGFVAVALVYAGVVAVDLQRWAGLVQRLATLVMLLPAAVLSLWLLLTPAQPRAAARR